MIKHYFKIALRNLWRNKLYTTLNVAGLTFGICGFLLIGLYLFDELTFDQQHSKADRIYRVIEHKNTKGERLNIAAASYKLAKESKKNIPEIETTTRIQNAGSDNILNTENNTKINEPMNFCDENLFNIFDFELIEGDKNTALRNVNSIVLVEEMALKLFNSTQIVGKTVKSEYLSEPLKVTGVIKNHPKNSSLNFTVMISEETFKNNEWYKNMVASDWSSNENTVFVLLKKNTKPETVAPKITQLIYANYKPEAGISMKYSLQPLKDIHLYSEDITDGARRLYGGTTNLLFYVRIFALIALFVLLIACINYMNLTTAKASGRSKEIGIKKAIGAGKRQLINQFLTESVLITSIAFVLAVVVVNLILPAFNVFADKQLSLGLFTDRRIWLIALLVTILTGLFSGSYPAFLLSRFSPMLLLRSLKNQSKSDFLIRKGLVIFQFTVSVVMIIATIVLFLQVRYLNNKDLGFNKEQLVVVDINSGLVRRGFETINAEFNKLSTIKEVSASSRIPGEWKTIPTIKIKTEGNTEDYNIASFIGADENFVNTFGIKLLDGRNFQNINDTTAIIINESAAKLLHIKQAGGQNVEIPTMAFEGSYFPVNQSTNLPFKARVVGIVKDFNFHSLRYKISPLVIGYRQNPVQSIDYFTARIDANNANTTLKKIEEILTKIDHKHFFVYHYLDQQLALFYADDVRRQTILIWVALATIFIACLGLFGLATYSAQQRVKEIGVRKVLGATVINLASLLSKDFLKLVLIANGIAFPVAWWAVNKWLQEYAYHINVEWWVFGLAGASAIVIALITVSFQAVKAATANPVKSIRTE